VPRPWEACSVVADRLRFARDFLPTRRGARRLTIGCAISPQFIGYAACGCHWRDEVASPPPAPAARLANGKGQQTLLSLHLWNAI
jgi:hypothetical protein